MATVRAMILNPEKYSFYRGHGVYVGLFDSSFVGPLSDGLIISSDQAKIDSLLLSQPEIELSDSQLNSLIMAIPVSIVGYISFDDPRLDDSKDDVLFIDGVYYGHSDNGISSISEKTQTKTLAKFDGVDAEIILPKTYKLESDGDYIEFVGKIDEKQSISALGTFGLKDTNTNVFGYSSSPNRIAIRNDGGVLENINLSGSGVDVNCFNRYRLTQTSSSAWSLHVNGVDFGAVLRTSFMLINNVCQGYIQQYCQATISEFKIHTSITGDISVNDFGECFTDKKLQSTNLELVQINYDKDSVICTSRNIESLRDRVQIAVTNKDNSKAVIYNYENSVDTDKASDVWKIDQCFIAEVLEYPLVYGRLVELTTVHSEWENAIRITADDDFVGGINHGKEERLSNVLLIDGKDNPLHGFGVYSGRSIVFKQSSNLYRKIGSDYKAINVAQSDKIWEFTSSKLNLKNNIKWKTSEILSVSYLAMLPLVRSGTDGVISNWGLWGESPQNVDISTVNFTPDFTNADSITAWSTELDKFSISATVTVKAGWSDSSTSHLTNSPIYNKLYFDYTGPHTTSPGEIISSEADYVISVT